ncbi:hypothetical protein DBR11_06285 [Pedobacter sp. HMWF019]|nr:hypothetical protein DBR11_06285 [Pedobacter sp. HMWF019]
MPRLTIEQGINQVMGGRHIVILGAGASITAATLILNLLLVTIHAAPAKVTLATIKHLLLTKRFAQTTPSHKISVR